TESFQVLTIGYLGGLDRGIAFGHVISEFNHGVVAALVATPGSAVNPANTPWPFAAFNGAKAFDGPEVQYVEWGADAPAVIRADAPPIFLVRIDIRDALPCDVFDFYVADYVTIWRDWVPGFPPAGAFSTTGLNTLDTGGDAVPDQTVTLAGVDADQPVPVPPGAYEVDYVDGPAGGGPATIRVTWPGELDYDLRVDLQDLATLLAHFGTPTDIRYEDGDLDEDGAVSLADLASLLAFFGHTCPR
ncbi:MAG: hypothetical protein HZB38_07230, partial [Planctomycetes bacterium]|nr:hypothetical protein [Planctomycetota bacterium]